MAKLSEKQKRFVQEYLKDLNATQAAARAGYKDPNIGRQLITKNNVSAEIEKRQKELQSKLEITQERVLEELAAIAFAKGTDYAQIEGGFVVLSDTSQLTEQQKAAIVGIKQTKTGVEIKLADKSKSLEMLARHLGLFDRPEKPEEDGEVRIIIDV